MSLRRVLACAYVKGGVSVLATLRCVLTYVAQPRGRCVQDEGSDEYACACVAGLMSVLADSYEGSL